MSANHNIKQIVDVCDESEKEEKLLKILKDVNSDRQNKIIVFVETKKKVDDVTKVIKREGFSAIGIHGDKSQPERDYVLSEFRTGKFLILVATDVAARGLDVEDVRHVINYDYPNSSEDYVHRIGRTGRCQQAGTAYAFFTLNNQRQAKDLIAVLEDAGQNISPQLRELAQCAKNGQVGRNNRWNNNRSKDSSSPSSQGSLKTKVWSNNKMFNGDMRQGNGNMRMNGSGPRMDGVQRNPRNNYSNGGGYTSYQNGGGYQNAGGYQQQSYQPNGVYQQQMTPNGPPPRGFGKCSIDLSDIF